MKYKRREKKNCGRLFILNFGTSHICAASKKKKKEKMMLVIIDDDDDDDFKVV